MSSPWMPLYVADYLRDTGHLNASQHGAYLILIMHYWSTGKIPTSDGSLAMLARMSSEEWKEKSPDVMAFFHKDDNGNYRHKRIDQELIRSSERYSKRAEAGRVGGRNKAVAMLEQKESSAEAKTCQSQSQPQDIIDANASIADAPAPATAIRLQRDGNKLAAERAGLRLVGQDWNSLAADHDLPQILGIDPGDTRERRVLQLIRKGFDFAALFTKIRASPWLRGDLGPTPCSFDWIFKPENLRKIMEGNYNREVRQAPAHQGYTGQQR